RPETPWRGDWALYMATLRRTSAASAGPGGRERATNNLSPRTKQISDQRSSPIRSATVGGNEPFLAGAAGAPLCSHFCTLSRRQARVPNGRGVRASNFTPAARQIV